MRRTYIAVDVESDGPVPGLFSMRSIAAVAFRPGAGIIGEFACNVAPLPEASTHPATMKWLAERPNEWSALLSDALPAQAVVADFVIFLRSVSKAEEELVFVSDYVGFDLSFVRYYTLRFEGIDPFWTRQLDLMSYASALTRRPQPTHASRAVPERWLQGSVHDHTSLNDARSHARLAIAMLEENRQEDFFRQPEQGRTRFFYNDPNAPVPNLPPSVGSVAHHTVRERRFDESDYRGLSRNRTISGDAAAESGVS